MATKTPDTRAALERVAALRPSIAVSLQNGGGTPSMLDLLMRGGPAVREHLASRGPP